MKILLISDVHGNWPALQAVLAAEPQVNQILCLGDLVNYGPQPAECVAWAMQRLTSDWLVQGNHDRAVALDEGSRSSVAYQALAVATQAASKQVLTAEMKQFLAGLQPLQRFQLDSAICVACHAVPSDPLLLLPSQDNLDQAVGIRTEHGELSGLPIYRPHACADEDAIPSDSGGQPRQRGPAER